MTDKNKSVIIDHIDARLEEKYYEVRHISGLSVYIFPKKRQSCCAILACEYGSINNKFNDAGHMVTVPDGIAHFLEHKMFEDENGISVEEKFSRLGADPNAYTKWDATAYFFTCGKNENFYPCLDELMKFVMNPYFTEESVEREKGIIGQEIVMCEDDPYDRCFLNLVKGLYEKNPVRIDVAGTLKSISKINTDLLLKCHKKFYTPANMFLVACGDIDYNKVIQAVDAFFAEEKYSDSARPCLGKIVEKKGIYKKQISTKMAVERPMFCLGFKDENVPEDSNARRKRELLAELVVSVIFASSGELYNDLYKRGIMTTPFTYGVEYGKSYGFVYAGGDCDSPELVLDEINKYIEKIKNNGINKDDFKRRQKMSYASDIRLYDSTWDIASALLEDAMAGVELFGEFDRIKELTKNEADQLLREILCDANMTISTVLPKK